MKQSKEQLVVEIAKIRQSHEEWVAGDENRRKEFAKAFGWYKKQYQFDHLREFACPTWPEIYVEIGKLLSNRDFRDFEGNISELEFAVNKLKEVAPKE